METTTTQAGNPATANRPRTILLGDDDEGIRHLLSELLHDEGFEVIEANGRQGAVEIFEQRHGDVDLILLDMSHARPTADDALSRLRHLKASAKVLLLTGNSLEEDVERTMRKGFNAFIPKPFTVSQLLEPLRQMMIPDPLPAFAA